MLLAVLSLGDLTVSAHCERALTGDDEMLLRYSLRFYDGVTDKYQRVFAKNENDLMLLFAVWIVSDSDDIGHLQPYRDALAAILYKDFMP